MRHARAVMGWVSCVGLLAIVPVAAAVVPIVPVGAVTDRLPRARQATGQPTDRRAPAADARPATSLESLAWMVGDWTGTAGKAGIEEHWIPAKGKTMMGVSRTTVGDRTVMFEFLRLEQRPDAIVYIAQPNGRTPTEFRLTTSGPSAATFENPQHDHPKIIRYWKEGDATLIAEIEGDEQGKHVKQQFTFSRGARP